MWKPILHSAQMGVIIILHLYCYCIGLHRRPLCENRMEVTSSNILNEPPMHALVILLTYLPFSTPPLVKNYMISNCIFRLPLCMVVSWSYVRHLVHLFLRINHFPFALIWSFSFLRLFFDIVFSDYFMEQLRRTRTDSALVLPVLTV